MAFFLTKIYNRAEALYRQATRRTNLTYNKYLPYFDGNDNFPLKWHQAISESPSATSCVSTIQDFLEGSGFSDDQLENRIVNAKGETFFQVHQKVSKDFGEFEGFYILLKFNAVAQVTEFEHLAFENCRLGRPDSNGLISEILYNPYFGTADFQTLKSSDTRFYNTYNPAGVKQQILEKGAKFQGQVLFVGTTTALSRFYPMPEATAALKWMKIETGVSDYHEDNINNGFLQPFMLIMKGNPNEPSQNPAYDGQPEGERITKGQEFDQMVAENFMGAKRVGNMWVHWIENLEDKPEVLAMPSNNSGDLFLAVDTQATKKITIAFKVPAILANINEGVSLGGDGNTVRVAVKLMQQRSVKKQRVLTDTYSLILKAMDKPYVDPVVITPYNPYPELEVIDQKLWDALSVEEKRKWIVENTDIELIEGDLEPPAPTQARLTNVVPMPFPESIKNKIKKAMEYREKMQIQCGRGGKDITDKILNNQNLGLKELKRVYNYLKKRPELENSLYNQGCEAIEYHSWGGKEMENFLEGKLKEVEAWLN
ncbi:MAG TPA: hypothetical protein VGK59_11645 [Ohtaekwangia sp.]